MVGDQHKVHIYLEYHSVCPLFRIGTPSPTAASPAGECGPPEPKGATLAWGLGGGGGPNADGWRKSLSLGLLCGGQHSPPPPRTIPPTADWPWRPLTKLVRGGGGLGVYPPAHQVWGHLCVLNTVWDLIDIKSFSPHTPYTPMRDFRILIGACTLLQSYKVCHPSHEKIGRKIRLIHVRVEYCSVHDPIESFSFGGYK